ncbi:hypothetical protein [uncultured Sphingomonas sp.]|uniref:DUF6975 family protein n=1 Tax=uncultured Sphingomonas sp. TaxID=158754 RepID=UPI002603E47A|nr:hypothetical protein [uncultured Sphingomonas sp.]
MALSSAPGHGNPGDFDAMASVDGIAAHPHWDRLLAPHAPLRDLADAVHAVTAIHGNHPGMIECALARGAEVDTLPWLIDAAAGFAVERAYLAQLTAAAGPLPSTPGQAETATALAQQRHTLEALANSDRIGSATGAVGALLADWRALRHVLDAAAARFGVEVVVPILPPANPPVPAAALALRARSFGANQLFAQHRGLWGLLEARASARRG